MKTNGKLFLFERSKDAAEKRMKELGESGWTVESEVEEGSRGCRNCKAFAPDVVVFDLAIKPSHSREAGRALRQFKPLRETPFVFVDGTEEDLAKTKEKVPGAVFTSSGKLTKILSGLTATVAAKSA